MNKKKDTISTIILILVILIGLSLLLYPAFSEYWNDKVSSHAVALYQEQLDAIDEEQYTELWEFAYRHNESLHTRENAYKLYEDQITTYNEALDVGGNGVMGYIEIPAINVSLPIYHGTSEPVLQIAVGHLEWTSLPTGGESSHTVLSGHRGLPSAKLFTDLDKLVVSDRFKIHILDQVLTYEVDQILIVLPDETDSLLIQEGKDLCTLVTCTPYGVNSHRLLVRGHRVENDADAVNVRVTSDAIQVEPLLIACFIGIPILGAMLVMMSLLDKLRDD